MKRLSLVLALTASVAAAQEDSEDITLLCIAEAATGFTHREETDKWEIARFNASSARYIFTKNDDGVYEFREFGESYLVSTCSSINDYGFGQCTGVLYDLSINVRTLRYQLIYPIGFVVAPEALGRTGDSPKIEIGVCTRL